jgi:surface protein
MLGMFYRCDHFNQNLSMWDVRNVRDMSYMFRGAVAFNGDISGWNTSAVTDMLQMFESASSFDQNLCLWGKQASALDYVTNMFTDSGCHTNDSPHFDDFSSGPWCQACSPTDSPIQYPSSLPTGGDYYSDDAAYDDPVYDDEFYYDDDYLLPTASPWPTVPVDSTLPPLEPEPTPILPPVLPETVAPTSAPTPFRVFTNTHELYTAVDEYLAAENPETTAVAELYGYPVGTWDVSGITDFSHVFDATFRNSDAAFFNEDVSQWDVSSATTMEQMFDGATAFNGDISRWNTSSVTFMTGMFAHAESFNRDLSAWSTSSLTQVGGMFYNAATFNQDLSDWNVEQVTFMPEMFRGATAFNQDLCFWGERVPTSVYTVDMFADSGCPVTGSPERLNLSASPWCRTCPP